MLWPRSGRSYFLDGIYGPCYGRVAAEAIFWVTFMDHIMDLNVRQKRLTYTWCHIKTKHSSFTLGVVHGKYRSEHMCCSPLMAWAELLVLARF